MQMGYCPNCKKNVMMVRADINVPLIIILAIFTAGFGVLVYFLFYVSNEPNRCIHCKSICQPLLLTNNSSSQPQLISSTTQNQQLSVNTIQKARSSQEQVIFCPNCGVHLGERSDVKYCAFCGTGLD